MSEVILVAGDLRQKAYDWIQGRIVSGALGAGQQVSELSLAKEVGLSRTPVREAIRKLVHEGLLEQVPRLGTVVRTPARRDIVELYELREALESYAVGLAAERIGPDDLAQLDQCCTAMRKIEQQLRRTGKVLHGEGMSRFLSADLAFHMTLLRAAGNARILKIVAESRVLTRIFGTRRQEHDARVVARAHRYHRRVLQALKKGDGTAARRILSEHIRASKQAALEHFDRPRLDDAALLPLSRA